MASESVEARIREARLIVAPPAEVAAELEQFGERLNKGGALASGDKQLEESLLARNDALINIALARYGYSAEVVGALYRKTFGKVSDELELSYLKGLRTACLSNEVVDAGFPGHFPQAVIGEEEFARVVTKGSDDEVRALFSNPNLHEESLAQLYKNEGLFASLSEERRWLLIRYSAGNPRLAANEDSEHGPDMYYWDIHRAIHSLLASAPATTDWLLALRELLDGLNPGDATPPHSDITPILDRWRGVSKEPGGYYTDLPMCDEFRCHMAATYGHWYDKSANHKHCVIGTANSDDIVLRCAYYGKAELTEHQMREGRQRDGGAYVLAVVCNDSVYFKPALRALLEEQLTLQLQWRYRQRCEQIHRRYPKRFDPRPISEWLKEDQLPRKSDEMTKLGQIEALVSSLASEVRAAKSNLLWAVVVLIVVVFFVRYFSAS